jgi:hypothetical protein
VSSIFFLSLLTAASLRFRSVLKGSFLISTFHASTILILTGIVIFSECWDSLLHYCHFDSQANSDLQQLILVYSMGYFITDSVVVLWIVPDPSAALHHVSILVGQLVTVFYGNFEAEPATGRFFNYQGASGYPLACFLFAAEISAPFLNAFMSGFAPKGSKFELISKAIFAVTFLISRLFICPFLTYEFVVNCPNAPLVPKVVCVCVMGISIYWSKAILGGIIEVVAPRPMKEILREEEEQREKRIKGE